MPALPLPQRALGPFEVSVVGLGCMNLSHAYGIPPAADDAAAVLLRALDLGITHFDTAALYGFGANEELVGRTLAPFRSRFTLASKCGVFGDKTDAGWRRSIDGSPATLKSTCEQALRRLRTEVIDLYYLHRWDKRIPIEESVGALRDLVQAGKIRSIGLSEVSVPMLRRAHAVHPIAAVQTEYSLGTRNPEIAILAACRDIGAAFVAFSPLGRGLLAGSTPEVAGLEPKDIRRSMPRFAPDAHRDNVKLLGEFGAIAQGAGCSMAQLALAWLLAQGPHVLVIPGTTQVAHLAENVGAASLSLSAEVIARAGALINQFTITGARYNAATQAEVDTENF